MKGSRRPGPRRREGRPRRWPLVGAFPALVIFGMMAVAGSLSLGITSSTEIAQGMQTPDSFLTHWQPVGVALTVTPTPVPRPWSHLAAFPTRLLQASGFRMVNPGTAGHPALDWSFNETPGIGTNTEIEVQLTVHYHLGAIPHVFTTKVYVETQRAPVGATFTYLFYWDARALAGVTTDSELAVAQACSAVGICP